MIRWLDKNLATKHLRAVEKEQDVCRKREQVPWLLISGRISKGCFWKKKGKPKPLACSSQNRVF